MNYTRTFPYALTNKGASQVTLGVKNQTANAGDIETWVRSPGGEDP